MKLDESLDLISGLFMKTNNKKDINDLLSDLLTPTEILDIYDRIMVVKLLNERVSQKEIACRLKISITTVSRGSRLFTFDKKIIHKLI